MLRRGKRSQAFPRKVSALSVISLRKNGISTTSYRPMLYVIHV